MCDLYLGAPNSRASTPPSPFWTNPSISSSTDPTLIFTTGSMSIINVMLQNHDAGIGAMSATANLWWSDPTTSFLLVAANQIGGSLVQAVGPAGPAGDANVVYNFGWSVPAAAATTNGGHVCLAAVVGTTEGPQCNEPAPSGNGMTADVTSPQVAIHNIHVNAAPGPGPMPPPPPGPGGGRGVPWPFFFGAANGARVAGKTRLVARAYDPKVEADQARLWELALHPGVRRAAGRCAKFAAPVSVHLATGVESVLVSAAASDKGLHPRLSFTGPVQPELAHDLVKRDWVKSAGGAPAHKEIDLLPWQVQQAAVWVEPHGHEGHLHAVEVKHELLRDGAPPVVLGGLTVVFVPACRPW
ncbi:MAG: hypothetical protein ACRENE_11985 [Polyangiaceae bacterium]